MLTHTAERENGKEPDLGADYVTLGAGLKARGSQNASLSFDSVETLSGGSAAITAGQYYRDSSGVDLPAAGTACLGFPDIKVNNASSRSEADPGLLASLLGEAGKTAAITGNEDGFRHPVRLAPLIVCGPKGVVGLGRVAGLTLPAPMEPGGLRTDMLSLASQSRLLLNRSDLLVIDTGDTGRADREGANMADAALKAARAAALKRADAFAAAAAGWLDLDSSLLVVVSPGAPMENRLKGDYATPFIAAGKGFGKGLLTSSSTRRPGYVNNVDFLPTVMDFFGKGVPSSVVGSSMATAGAAPGSKGTMAYLQSLDRQYTVTRTAKWPVVLGFLIGMGIFLLLALASIPRFSRRVMSEQWRSRIAGALRPVSIVLLAAPVSFLLVSAFSYSNWVFPLLFCSLYTLVVGLGAYFLTRGRDGVNPAARVCLFSAAVMSVDLLFGGRLLIFPLLGSSAQDGARFFGQSNAIAGLMIAYALWGVAGLGEKAVKRGPARWAVLVALAFIAFIVGFGSLGANFGAFIAAAATGVIFFFGTTEKGFRGWRVPAIVLGTAAATVAMVAIDGLFVHTHAGHALAAGSGQDISLVGRKLAILFGQIKSILFLAILMIVVVVAFALWMKRPGSMWRERWKTDTAWTAGLFAILLGSIVALVFNDTGIAMMGSMVMVTVPVLVYHFTEPLKESP